MSAERDSPLRKKWRERGIRRITGDILEKTGERRFSQRIIFLALANQSGDGMKLVLLHLLMMRAEETRELRKDSARGERAIVSNKMIRALPTRAKIRLNAEEVGEDIGGVHLLLPNVKSEPTAPGSSPKEDAS